MKIVLRLLSALLASLVGLIGLVGPASAALPLTASQAIYAYDSQCHSVWLTYTVTERGPPTSSDPESRRGGVDHERDGTSARPEGRATPASTTYRPGEGP